MNGEIVHHYRKEPQGPREGIRGLRSRLFHGARRGGMPRINESAQVDTIIARTPTQPITVDARLINTPITSSLLGVEGLRAQFDQQSAPSMPMTDASAAHTPSETLTENANMVADRLPYSIEESGGVDGLKNKLDRDRRTRRGKLTAKVVLSALVPALAATACSSGPTQINGAVYNTIDCTKPVEPDILLTQLSSAKPVVDQVTSNSDNQEVALLAPGQTVRIDQGGTLIADISSTTITANNGHTVVDRTGQEVVLEEAQSANNTYKAG